MKFYSPNLALGAVILIVFVVLGLWLYPWPQPAPDAPGRPRPAASAAVATPAVPESAPAGASASVVPSVQPTTVSFLATNQSLRAYADEVRVPVSVLGGPPTMNQQVRVRWVARTEAGVELGSGLVEFPPTQSTRFVPVRVPGTVDAFIATLGDPVESTLGVSSTRVTVEC